MLCDMTGSQSKHSVHQRRFLPPLPYGSTVRISLPTAGSPVLRL